jgi:hypothetical protein
VASNSNQTMQIGQFNSTQLNIVTTIDVENTLWSNSIDGRAFMMDNGPESTGKGTTSLRTVCKQGQVLNWLIYCSDMQQRADGTWPPMAKIANIVMLSDDGESVLGTLAFADLKIFGGPDELRSPYTPSYYYWAGMILPDLTPGLYRYRLILELDTESSTKKYFQISTPSLQVLPLNYEPGTTIPSDNSTNSETQPAT